MGMLRIVTTGSFSSPVNKTFPAQERGHAVAVDNAIKFLQGYLKEAQAQDTRLHLEGLAPDDGFEEAFARKLIKKEKPLAGSAG